RFRRGRDDQEVVWHKPQRHKWMDKATYATMPKSLILREVRKQIREPGFRVRELVVVTTLTDTQGYSKDAILDLFHDRWHGELDLRAIKQSLQMEVLRCQTPAMLRKEIWAHLLAYNLVRKVKAKVRGKSILITVPAVLFGGDGNDSLDASGSSANNIL